MTNTLRVLAAIAALCLTSIHPLRADDAVSTIIQQAHAIEDYDITADGKYLVSTNIDGTSIAIWDIGKRRMAKLISHANDKRIRCHPIHPEIVYVADPSTAVPDQRGYYGLNILTGEHSGFLLGKDLPERHTYHDEYILRKKAGKIFIKSRKTKRDIGVLDGFSNLFRYGGMAVNANDSLVALAGQHPAIWDLKNLTISSNIPYRDFLESDSTLKFPNNSGVPIPKTGKPDITTAHEILMYSAGGIRNERFNHHYAYQDHFQCYFDRNDDLWMGGYNKWITKWGLSGILKAMIPTQSAPVYSILTKGDELVAATYEGVAMLDYKNKLVSLVPEPASSIYKVTYSISRPFRGNLFATADDGGKIRIGKIGERMAGKSIFNISNSSQVTALNHVEVSPDDNRLLASGQLSELYEISIDNPKEYIRYDTGDFSMDVIWNSVYLDNTRFATADAGGRIAFWSCGDSKPRKIHRCHLGGALNAKLSRDGKYLYTSDEEGSLCIWDSKNETPVVTALNFNQGKDYIFITPDNYYKASLGALEGVHFAKGLEIYPLEQFDLKYNRPDIVMTRLGMDQQTTEPYYKAWQKRLRRMGYTEQMLGSELHAPEVTIVNQNEIPGVTSLSTVSLDIAASDSQYPLHKFFVNLNGVPLLGKVGKNIGKSSSRSYKEKIEIELCEGNNFIEVFAINSRGVESFRKTLNISYEPVSKKEKTLYIAAIGVSSYADKSFNLEYAAKDARDIVCLLENPESALRSGYSRIEKLELTDENFSPQSLKDISGFFSRAGREDAVVLFYAGHGLLDKDLNYYLSHHNTDFDNPQNNSIPYDEFENVLENSRSLSRLCLIDACHSGEIDKEDYSSESINTAKGKVKFRSAGTGARKVKGYGVAKTQALFSELFMDIRWGIGATIVSSAGGMEAAMEGENWGNGLFTWCLKKGIADMSADLDNDGHVGAAELGNYLCREVSKLSEGRQTPTMRAQNIRNNFFIR